MGKNLLRELRELFPAETGSGQDINPIVFSLIKQGVNSKRFFDVNEKQIREVLKNVPRVFPEDGRMNGYRSMFIEQKMTCRRVSKIGGKRCPIEVIIEVVNYGVKLKLAIDTNFKDDELCRVGNRSTSTIAA